LGNAGLLFNDEDELAEAIEKLIYDNKLRACYARKALTRIIGNGLSLNNVAEKYFKLYRSIL